MLKGMKGPGHLKMKIDTSMLGDPDFDSSESGESGTEEPIDSNDDSDPSMDESALAPYDDDDDDLLVESVQKKSIYITEKSTKKKMLKDGKVNMALLPKFNFQ